MSPSSWPGPFALEVRTALEGLRCQALRGPRGLTAERSLRGAAGAARRQGDSRHIHLCWWCGEDAAPTRMTGPDFDEE